MTESLPIIAFVGSPGLWNEGLWIELLERPFLLSESDWDRDHIVAKVRVEAGAFRGAFTTLLASYELLHLRRTLEAMWVRFGHSAHGEFSNLEGTIHLTFDVTKTGQVLLAVKVREAPERKAFMQFVVEAEYIRLQDWMDMLRDALEQFPPQMHR